MKFAYIALCAAFLLAAPLFTAPADADLPPLIPRTLLFGNPEKGAPQISPDGKKLAYLAPSNGVLNVFVRTLGKSDDAVVTSDAKRGIRAYFWQPDSAHILYTQDQGGDENFHVYQTGIASKDTQDLTPFPKVQARIVSVDPRFPDFMLAAINDRDPRYHDIYKIDFKTAKAEKVYENRDEFAALDSDNQMRIRTAIKTLPDGGSEIFVRDTEQSPWRSFLKAGADEQIGTVGFSPDDKALWLQSTLGANAARLIEADIASGKQKVVAEDKQFDVGGVMVNPIKRNLEAVSFVRARTEWKIIDNALKGDFDALRKVRDGDFSITSRDDADTKWVITYVLDNAPVTYYLYDRATKKAELLFTARPALEKVTLAKIKPIEFTARDGMKLYGYLTLPEGVAPKNLPTILLVHGGPWARDTWGYNGIVQFLANRGYAVLMINFRGSTGYGKAYLNAGDRQWGLKMHDDLLDGKAWAIKNGYADPKRVGIMGGSYGGYATLAALAFTPDEFAAGVDIVGPSNLNTLMASIPPYWEAGRAQFKKRMGDTEAFLTERSPLFKAGQITKPLLIGQGANDPRVNIRESDQIVEALRKAGKPVEYIVFPDEGHGFARPQNNLFFLSRAEAFLAKHLGGRAEPITEVPGASGEVR